MTHKFISGAQRKAVMAKLRKDGFKANKLDRRGRTIRARQFPPSRCQRGSFRTIDIGRKGGTKAVICRPEGLGGKTRIQTVLVRGE